MSFARMGMALALGIYLCSTVGAAAAEPDKRAAKKALRSGDRHLKKGDRFRDRGKAEQAAAEYEAALVEYQSAYKAFPSPKIFFPIGQVEERLGRDLEAYQHYQELLATGGDEIDDNFRAQVELQLEKLKERLSFVTLDVAPAGAEVSVDGAVVGTAPLPEPIALRPGEHRYTVTLEGHRPRESAFSAEAGTRPVEVVRLELTQVEQVAEAPKKGAAPAVKRRRRARSGRTRLVVGVGVTAGLAAIATVTGVMATSEHGKYTDETLSALEREDARDKGKSLALTTDLLLVGAVAAGAYTTYYYYKVYKPRQQSEHQRDAAAMRHTDMWVLPYATASGGGVAAGGSF